MLPIFIMSGRPQAARPADMIWDEFKQHYYAAKGQKSMQQR